MFSSFSCTLVRFSIKIDDFDFEFQKTSLSETSLMLWLHGNGFIKGGALLALAGILHKNN